MVFQSSPFIKPQKLFHLQAAIQVMAGLTIQLSFWRLKSGPFIKGLNTVIPVSPNLNFNEMQSSVTPVSVLVLIENISPAQDQGGTDCFAKTHTKSSISEW